MKLKGIYTNRGYETWPSWDLIYEWEDIYSTQNNLPLYYVNKKNPFFYRVVNKLKIDLPIRVYDRIFNSKTSHLYHLLNASFTYNLACRKKIIPVIVDFYLKKEELQAFYELHRDNKCLLISSLEVFYFLKRNNCPIPIFHFPLSLSNIYKIEKQTSFIKKYDILLAGRQNSVLEKYFKKFLQKYPDTEYVYREQKDGHFTYISNKQGILGEFNTRNEFIALIQSSRIAFYSTPGMDEVGESRTNGFNQVTPRYLELLAAGCKILGRYPKNQDTNFYELDKFCPNVNSYEEFEILLTDYLSDKTIQYDQYALYLKKYYTSERAKLLNNIFEKI